MPDNFKIITYRTKESLHMKLSGDFDGSSASELINHLRESGNSYYNVFVNTSGLRHIHPFGRAVFHMQLSGVLNKKSCITFIGKNIGQTNY
jgi:hypothetical protein